jgi:hypothetical protein
VLFLIAPQPLHAPRAFLGWIAAIVLSGFRATRALTAHRAASLDANAPPPHAPERGERASSICWILHAR